MIAVAGAADRVEIDVAEDLPLVQVDAGLLERVLANLIDNALRHGGDGAPVQITATAGSSSAKLAVVDHGPGVPEADRERLFTPFRHLGDRAGTRRWAGALRGARVHRGDGRRARRRPPPGRRSHHAPAAPLAARPPEGAP